MHIATEPAVVKGERARKRTGRVVEKCMFVGRRSCWIVFVVCGGIISM